MESNFNNKDFDKSKYIAIAKDQFSKLKNHSKINNQQFEYKICKQSIENCLISNFLTNSELVEPILSEIFDKKNLKNKGTRKNNRMDEEEYIEKFLEAYSIMIASTDIDKAFDDININLEQINEMDLVSEY